MLSFYCYQNATREPYKTLGDSLRRNPRHIIDNYPKFLEERLIEYNGVLAHVYELYNYRHAEYIHINEFLKKN